MTDAMIWTFGILLFVVLMRLVTAMSDAPAKWTGGIAPNPVTRKDLSALSKSLEEIKGRLTSIEEILRSVE